MAVSVTREAGIVYVASPKLWQNVDITAEKMNNLRSNPYAAGLASKQRNLVFSKRPYIEVYDQNNDIDEKLQTHLTLMMESPEVDYISKMIIAFDEVFFEGMGIFNWVWERVGNEYRLTQLNHLPSHSFDKPNTSAGQRKIYSQILRGVTLGPDGKIQFWQNDGISLTPVEISRENLFWIKDPIKIDLAGDPSLRPLVAIIEMLSFSWGAEMQFVNRAGAPPLFIKISNPQGKTEANGNVGDVEYAETILAGWGKDNQYPIRGNMELIFPNITDTGVMREIIDVLHWVLIDYFSPSSAIQTKDATTIGGSSGPQMELLLAYIDGIHRWLEQGFNLILQRYLDANNYKGYSAKFVIPSISTDQSQKKLQEAQIGYISKTLHPNEVRNRLDAEGLDDDALQQIKAAWDMIGASEAAMAAFAQAGGGLPNGEYFPVGRESLYLTEEGQCSCGNPGCIGQHLSNAEDPLAPIRKAKPELRHAIEKRAYVAIVEALNILSSDLMQIVKEDLD
jgi:hypothetical protein